MRKGYKKELQIEDEYRQRRGDESERLTDRLERYSLQLYSVITAPLAHFLVTLTSSSYLDIPVTGPVWPGPTFPQCLSNLNVTVIRLPSTVFSAGSSRRSWRGQKRARRTTLRTGRATSRRWSAPSACATCSSGWELHSRNSLSECFREVLGRVLRLGNHT